MCDAGDTGETERIEMAMSKSKQARLYAEQMEQQQRDRGYRNGYPGATTTDRENATIAAAPKTLVHADDPHTSVLAAVGHPGLKSGNRVKVLRTHAMLDKGATDDEIAGVAGLTVIEARRRSSDLRNLEYLAWVEDDEGKRVTRLSLMGSPATVSKITAKGREALETLPPE